MKMKSKQEKQERAQKKPSVSSRRYYKGKNRRQYFNPVGHELTLEDIKKLLKEAIAIISACSPLYWIHNEDLIGAHQREILASEWLKIYKEK